jgi:hypothetical protein
VLDHAVAAKKRGQSNPNVADLIGPLGDVPMKMNDEIIVEPRMTVDPDFHCIGFGVARSQSSILVVALGYGSRL